MDVVILAGGLCGEDLRSYTGVTYRAELPFGDKPMLDLTMGVLSGLGKLIIVGGTRREGSTWLEGGKSFIESLRRGLEAVETETFLLATVDIPFLTQESVEDFLAHCQKDALINYPIVPVHLCEERFPGLKRTALRLREGRFTGGNIALMNRDLMLKHLPLLERAYALRKKPFRLAAFVGLNTLFRVLMGQLMPGTLPLKKLEDYVGKFLGAPVHAVISEYPEIATDIDHLEQYLAAIALKNPAGHA